MEVLKLKDLIKFKGVWHSVRIEHIEEIFKNNSLAARTNHRYWPDGRVRRDNEGDVYQNSHYMKGWSMTRDRNYAFSWAAVTFLFDWDKIKRDFQTKTVSWSYRNISCRNNFDKEREEFVISNFMNQNMNEIKEEYFSKLEEMHNKEVHEDDITEWKKDNGTDFIEYWRRKGDLKIDLDKYLIGIFVDKVAYDIYKGRGFDVILSNPLFKGFVCSEQAKINYSKSLKDFVSKF